MLTKTFDISQEMDKSTSITTIADYKKEYIFNYDQSGGEGQDHSNFPVPYFKGDGQDDLIIWLELLRTLLWLQSGTKKSSMPYMLL